VHRRDCERDGDHVIPLPVLANVRLPQLDSVTCTHKKTLFRAHVGVQSEHMHIQIRGSECFMLGASDTWVRFTYSFGEHMHIQSERFLLDAPSSSGCL
jgi:hypothetical protein